MYKNEAELYYKGEAFVIYQDQRDNWRFTYRTLVDINTQHKELQPALNEVYATVDDMAIPKRREPVGLQTRHRRRGNGRRRKMKGDSTSQRGQRTCL